MKCLRICLRRHGLVDVLLDVVYVQMIMHCHVYFELVWLRVVGNSIDWSIHLLFFLFEVFFECWHGNWRVQCFLFLFFECEAHSILKVIVTPNKNVGLIGRETARVIGSNHYLRKVDVEAKVAREH